MYLFTETLKQFLENRGGDFSAPVNSLFSKIPDFKYKDENVDITFNFKEMFIHEHLYHEIGSETEELFEYNLERRLDDVVLEYAPKISLFLKTFNDKLMLRTVELKRTGNNTYNTEVTRHNEGTNGDTDYVNPITKQVENLTVRERSTTDYKDDGNDTNNRTDTIDETYQQQYSIAGKSNADLLKEIMDLKNIYLGALNEFGNLFMYLE